MNDGETSDPHEEPTEDLTRTVRSGPAAQPEKLPESVGPYRILERLGEGGMGEVYLAEQTEPVRRRVALKVIKQGMDTKSVVARFEAERQALAMMNHPCVARVFDAGATEGGQPYFAMEYVKGLPIIEHCNRQRLSTRERLDLFMQVCDGVQHAHQKAIIHRDLKPSNILVAYQDGKATPKIIDFGVAKAVDHRLTERTLYTEIGVLIGTPEYMSPEQAEMSGQDVDTRTDVYSLGVVLYELLVGALPFDSKELRAAGFDEIRRKIREDQPSTPSRRLSTLEGKHSIESAKYRGTDLSTLRSQLSGDLDWITMRALEKDRARRYGSPSDLAADLERHLTSQPILARPPSTLYRLGKFVRRNKALVGGMVATLVVLLAGIAVSTVQRIEANQQREEANRQRDEAIRQKYVANMTAAESSLRLNELALAKRQIAECPEELRGWEWDYLSRRLDESVASYKANEDMLLSIAFNPDGSQIATAGREPVIRVLDATTGEVLASLEGHEGFVRGVTFSPDGKSIASAGQSKSDLTVRVWDAETGDMLHRMTGHEDSVLSVAYSPDGKRIASGSWDGAVRVWDAATGAFLSKLDAGDGGFGLEFSPDGAILAGSDGILVRLWDATSGKRLKTLKGHEGPVTGIGFGPDGSRVVSASLDGTIRVWDVATGEELSVYDGDYGGFWAVAFSPDGKHLSAGTEDRKVRVWDAATGELLATLVGHEGVVASVSFSPDGVHLASGSGDGTVKLWDLPRLAMTSSGEMASIMKGHEVELFSVVFSPDGTRIASSAMDRSVRLWDTATGELLASPSGHEDKGGSLALFSGSDLRIASGSGTGTIRLWDPEKDEPLATLTGHEALVLNAAFSPDSTRLVTGSADKTARLWDPDTGQLLATLTGHEEQVNDVAFSPDGTRIATCSGDNVSGLDKSVRIWDAGSGMLLATLEGHTSDVWSIAFSPDGSRIASASQDSTVRLWDATSGEPLAILRGHDAWVQDVTFSPDGARIIAGSTDSTVRMWDAETGDLLLALRGHRGPVNAVAFSPDGTRIVSGDKGGFVRLW